MSPVRFPPGTVRCAAGKGLSFRALVEKRLVVCEVTAEALMQCFGAESPNCSLLMKAFELHRRDIEKAADARLVSSEVASVRLSVLDFR